MSTYFATVFRMSGSKGAASPGSLLMNAASMEIQSPSSSSLYCSKVHPQSMHLSVTISSDFMLHDICVVLERLLGAPPPPLPIAAPPTLAELSACLCAFLITIGIQHKLQSNTIGFPRYNRQKHFIHKIIVFI